MAGISAISRSAVNYGYKAPIQAMDTNAYMQDQATGTIIPLGEFTGLQYVIRNDTEPYIPMGFRTPIYLDGIWQIAFILEQGLVNIEGLKYLQGYDYVGPSVRLGRSPRFQLVVEYNAQELDESAANSTASDFNSPNTDVFSNSGSLKRAAKGRYVFGFCKIDAVTNSHQGGRSVVASRIEGLATSWEIQTLDNPIPRLSLSKTAPQGGDRAFLGANKGFKADLGAYGKLPDWANGTFGK